MKKIHLIAAMLLCQCINAQNWSNLQGTKNYPIYRFYNDTVTNKLLAIGSFDSAGTIQAQGVAVWDGNSWSSLGTPIFTNPSYFYSVTRYNGNLYLGGGIPIWNNVSPSYLTRWNGSTLDSIGHFVVGGANGLLTYQNNLIAYDHFSNDTVNNIPFNGVAQWDGANWSDLGHSAFNGSIFDMVVYKGKLYACGFSSADFLVYVFCYENNAWHTVGSNFSGTVSSLCVYNNELYVGGYHGSSSSQNAISKLDTLTNTWNTIGGGVSSVSIASYSSIEGMCVHNGKLCVVGTFDHAGGVPAVMVAKWDGTQWCGLGVNYNSWDATNCVSYNDSLYLSTGIVFDNATTECFVEWVGGNYTDTCGFLSTGINEQAQNFSITVFPNPVTTKAIFRMENLDGNKTLIIYDQLGKEIWRKETTENEIEFSTDGFAKGLYFYRIENENTIAQGKFIVE
jgi:hypothetical protein